MDMNEATAKAIAAERSIAGITIRELSIQANIPQSSLMRVLQAEREIKVNQVAKIALALGLYPHEIIETAENILEREQRREQAGVVELGFDRAGRLVDLPADLAAHRPGYDPDDEITD